MYKAFYGLREKPFNLTPDPRFLYLSEKHKEAFAHLLYGIRSRSGFVMVTGEIGTGKTTICRNLLNQLDEDTEVAFIFNPMLCPLELLRKIVSEFGIDARGNNALELTEELNEYLLEAAAKGKNCVLLIDEAQNLDPQVLEQIRLLSNLETETEKLLQIVLIGQPELGEKLELHELRQLNQRITARYHLRPLSDKEVTQYVAYRLHVAGGRRRVKFAKPAIRAVYKISKGTPRVINALCDRALLIGFTRETHTITKGIIHRAYREIRGDAVFGQQGRRWTFRQLALNPITAIVALCIAAAIYLNSPALQARATDMVTRVAAALPAPAAPEANSGKNVVDAKTVVPPDSEGLAATEALDSESATRAAEGPIDTASPETIGPVETSPGASEADLHTVLAESSPRDSNEAALEALLTAWGKDTAGPLPTANDNGSLDRFFRAHGWSYDRLTPALDQLIALDLPALVKIVTDDGPRWVTLLHAKDDTLTVAAGGEGPVTVDRTTLQTMYSAEAIVPWHDPAPGRPAMREGQASDAVAELKNKLRSLDRLRAENTSNTYDAETVSAIARIQAETSLDVDGIAGTQVRMVLSSWLKESDAPSLSGRAPAPEVFARKTPPAPPAASAKSVEDSASKKPEAAVETPDTPKAPPADPEPATATEETTEAAPADAIAEVGPAKDTTELPEAEPAVEIPEPAVAESAPEADETPEPTVAESAPEATETPAAPEPVVADAADTTEATPAAPALDGTAGSTMDTGDSSSETAVAEDTSATEPAEVDTPVEAADLPVEPETEPTVTVAAEEAQAPASAPDTGEATASASDAGPVGEDGEETEVATAPTPAEAPPAEAEPATPAEAEPVVDEVAEEPAATTAETSENETVAGTVAPAEASDDVEEPAALAETSNEEKTSEVTTANANAATATRSGAQLVVVELDDPGSLPPESDSDPETEASSES